MVWSFEALLQPGSKDGSKDGSSGDARVVARLASGESALLPPMRPGFESRRRRHMWVQFDVGSLSCSKY